MALSLQPSWPAAGSVAAGVMNLYLARHVWRFRNRPGGRWFTLVAVLMAVSCLSYGTALLAFEPLWLRKGLELVHWATGAVMGGAWLAFALAYTGRGHLLRTTARNIVAVVVGLAALFPLTAPLHGLFWRGFRLDPTFGAATATFVREPGAFAVFGFAMVFVAVSLVVLLDTIVSYGQLFRSQTVALVITPVFPTVAVTTYAFQFGPVPNLNLVPVALAPHALLDLYALFGAEMFEFDPATRRIGARTATDDLGNPIVTADTSGRIITLNDAATDLLDVDKRHVVGDDLDQYLGDDLALDANEQTIEVTLDERRRQYRVTSSPFSDATGSTLGYNLVLQDVSDVVQRERRLAVLNRVLRHNLRNDLSVVNGNAAVVAEQAEDPQLAAAGETIADVGQRLATFGERAREFDRILDAADEPDRPVALGDLLDDVAAEVRADYPDATVEVDVPADLRVRQQPSVLELVFRNLLDNAVEHNDATEPWVAVRTTGVTDGGSVHVAVVDDGPGIPDTEVSVLEDGDETALEHGSGLGLWVVHSGVTAMGGDVDFETRDGGGTRVSVRLPGVVDRTVAETTA